MTLRSKLLLAQSPLWAVLLLVAIVATLALRHLGAEAELILKDNYRSVLAAERMKESIERIDSGAMFAFTGHRAQGLAQADDNLRRFESELSVAENNITEKGEADVASRLRSEWIAYRAAFEEFRLITDENAARARYYSDLQVRFTRIKNVADEILGINQDAMITKSERAQHDARQVVALLGFGSALAIAFAAYAASSFVTRILRPVSVLTQTVQRIGAGDLAVRAAVDGTDEIGHLAREFNALADSVAAYRKSSLGDLIQAQQSAQAAIDSLADPVVVFGSTGPVLAINRAAEDLLGISAESVEPLGRADPAAREAIDRARNWVTSGKGPFVPKGYEEAVHVPTKEGEAWFLVRANAIYTDVGISGVTVVLQDVTRLRRFDELTRDLVATVAHEFRTPLTSLQMAIHLCVEQLAGPVTEKQADLLQAAREDCNRLLDLVEDLLDVSRLQAGRAELQRTPVDAEELIADAIATHQSAADARTVSLAAIPGEGAIVSADRERARLVLSNLVSNAIRHAGAGGHVTIGHAPNNDVVRFEVIDDGPGIPAEWRGRVFEKFVRIPGADAGGAGLGLHIAREIITAHGGTIGVDDAPGGGTMFWFTLARATVQPAS